MNVVNEVRISGRAVKDATKTGNGPYRFSIATGGGKKRDSEQRWPTEYFDVTWFSDRGNQVKRGAEVEVVGRLRQSRWERDGEKHSRVEIAAKEVTGQSIDANKAEPLTPRSYCDIEAGLGLTITDQDIPF